MSDRRVSDDFVTSRYDESADLKRNASGPSGRPDLSRYNDLRKPEPKLTKRQKLRDHCSRFWCCWAIFFIAALAVGLPLLFLVIMPAIAQRIVNDTSLPIYGADLRPINSTHLTAGLSTGLSLPGGLNVKLDGCDLWLYNPEKPDAPYARVPIPDQYVKGGGDGALQIEDIVGEVTDQNEINKWLTQTLYGQETSISVKATTTAWLGAIKIPLTIDKTVTTPGLRGLSGTSLTEARLYIPPQEDGTNVDGTMVIPNYSIMTMDLGNVTLNALSGDILIGSVELQNALLVPGNNTMPFRGEIFLEKVLANIFGIAASQADNVFRGMVRMTASGNQTVINDVHIGYLEDVLGKARINVDVPIVQLIGDVVGSWSTGTLNINSVFQEILDGFVGENSTISGIIGEFTEGEDGTPGGLWNDVLSNWNLTRIDNALKQSRRARRGLAQKLYGA